ncbi:SLC45 family MFS transporter [Thermanaerothrix daxensis]|uniref:SLC45 family MFS transporter n=1 Tax=Thermanaerothrix daxensis TaxID=869279 RepID=UPI0006C8F2BD|nr:SLC45 family MFS transporter [Thermanaerothrix daxensis]
MKSRFSIGKIFLLGFGFFGVSVIWSVYNAYVPIFLRNRFDIPPGIIGFFMTLDNLAALFIQPPVGAWSDRLRTPIGRRLPFILAGAPISALAFGLIPLQTFLPFFMACTITLILSMAFWRTPVVALMPDITPSRYRSQANGIINFMGGVGAIIAFFIGASLYEMNPAYPFWLGSALVILAALMVFAFIREPQEYEITDETPPSLWQSLRQVVTAREKSALRILLAIFFWFVAYNAIEAFFTLYAVNHLHISEADGARLLGQLSLFFVLFALPAGFLGSRLGRRRTILSGILLLTAVMLVLYFTPAPILTTTLFRLPVLGVVPIAGVSLMVAGIAWALININSLPMVVDMTDDLHIGTYTGLYYLFSTLAAIVGPNLNGWIIQLSGENYALIMIVAPFFMLAALIMMLGVRRGEAKAHRPQPAPAD